MTTKLDPELRKYATEKQWLAMEALAEHGSERKAAKVLGLHKSGIWAARTAVIRKAAKHGYAPDYDLLHAVPDGFRLRGASTMYDCASGEPKVQWVKSEIDKERQEQLFRAAVEAMASELPRLAPQPGPEHGSTDLMACYPVGDHHLGMLSWAEETGADYDLKIGEDLLMRAMDYLVEKAPPCEHATVVVLGDFLHYDSFEAITPTSRNILDSDTRFPKMVRAAIRCTRYMITSALRRHVHIHVIVEIGNHDLSSSIFLMECLKNIYENEPRISIDTSPAHYHYFSFGKVLVGTHHGHGTKMENLPLIMATDQPDLWGSARFRYWWTGHLHRSETKVVNNAKDFSGCTVERFRVLCPADAWAAQKGYRAIRDMKTIILHKEYGEVERHTVNPDMF